MMRSSGFQFRDYDDDIGEYLFVTNDPDGIGFVEVGWSDGKTFPSNLSFYVQPEEYERFVMMLARAIPHVKRMIEENQSASSIAKGIPDEAD